MYNYNYYPDYLYHYGVKGMKWGHRKKYYNSDGSLNKVGQARQNYKAANKAYNKAYNDAYNYSSLHPVGQWTNKKKKAESDRRWDDAINKADKANKAKQEYKQAKKEARNTPEAKAARRKTAIKLGVVAAGAALAAHGAYKLKTYVEKENAYIRGKQAGQEIIRKVLDASSENAIKEQYWQMAENDSFKTAVKNVIKDKVGR